jgi:hypothetical protein
MGNMSDRGFSVEELRRITENSKETKEKRSNSRTVYAQ